MARKRKEEDTPKRKSVFAAFKPQDYRELEQYLNKMAADGWMVQRSILLERRFDLSEKWNKNCMDTV